MRLARPKAVIAPAATPDTAFWWEGLARGALLLPECGACGRTWFPPGPTCPHCGGGRGGATTAKGTGTLYSWVVVRRALHPAFADEIPYAVGAVALDEGPRVYGRIVDVEPEELRDGLPLTAVVHRVGDQAVLCFRLR